jgi:hypothetical protein
MNDLCAPADPLGRVSFWGTIAPVNENRPRDAQTSGGVASKEQL